ncbi:hypothetical protein F4859DRAFT_375367 [Xylaria cf. heliscus]|nr:hypothetical protein F4859DRAFT_375367 [Xylaria cf. heliscus]
MPEYDYIKISTSGEPRFVRSHSFSHHHRPRHIRSRCPDNCACVSLDEWNSLIERERSARSANDSLLRENRSLKSELHTTYKENRRLQGNNRGLQGEAEELKGHISRDENNAAKLHRKIAALKAEVDSKDLALHDLKKDKDIADIRVRELSQTVTDQSTETARLEDEVALLNRMRKKDQYDLGVRTEEVREAWSLVRDLQRQLRKCCDPFSFRRRYDFA